MQVMLSDRLRRHLERQRDKAFLKAVLAMCALAARADPAVALPERFRIERIVRGFGLGAAFEPQRARRILEGYAHALASNPMRAQAVLAGKVERLAGDQPRARAALSLAY